MDGLHAVRHLAGEAAETRTADAGFGCGMPSGCPPLPELPDRLTTLWVCRPVASQPHGCPDSARRRHLLESARVLVNRGRGAGARRTDSLLPCTGRARRPWTFTAAEPSPRPRMAHTLGYRPNRLGPDGDGLS